MTANPGDLARAGMRQRAGQIVAGVAGTSTLALLAAGSLVPLIGPLAAGGLTAEQAIGQMLQILIAQQRRLRELERRVAAQTGRGDD